MKIICKLGEVSLTQSIKTTIITTQKTDKVVAGVLNTISAGLVNVYTKNEFIHSEIPQGAINGTNVNFALVSTPSNNSLKLDLNGLRCKIGEDYTLSGNIITFILAPLPGDLILADYIK